MVSFKRRVSGIWNAWKLLVIIILCIILIPLAITQEHNTMLQLWIIAASLLVYIVLTTVSKKIRGKIGKYLLNTAHRLLLGAIALSATVVLFRYELESWGRISIIASAILYAFFVQRISFLRVIGL